MLDLARRHCVRLEICHDGQERLVRVLRDCKVRTSRVRAELMSYAPDFGVCRIVVAAS